jgi:hypothetical protein
MAILAMTRGTAADELLFSNIRGLSVPVGKQYPEGHNQNWHPPAEVKPPKERFHKKLLIQSRNGRSR